MTQFERELGRLLVPEQERPEPGWPGASQPEPEEPKEEPAGPPEPDLGQARSLLTAPLPAGFGEVLVTDVWLPPAREEENPVVEQTGRRERRGGEQADWRERGGSEREGPQERAGGEREAGQEKPADSQQAWETRQELGELGLLRERPMVRYDARTEQYWNQVRDARREAENAIIDPYTSFVTAFADVEYEGIPEYRSEAREYGRRGNALLELGRAYVVVGRLTSARSTFRAAAKADVHNPRIWWHLGVSHLFARANAEAAKALERAVDQFPGDFHAELALGVACYHMRDYARAEQHFSRLAGESGLRATTRSMLACSKRMQGKWDDARIELSFLRDCRGGDWAALADQCLDCVERGEQKRKGPVRARRRSRSMLKALAAVAGGGAWIAYSLAQDLFEDQPAWAALPLFLLVALVARGLRGISGKELSGEFGNAEQGLPCWQATKWLRPRRAEF